jgi:hypothetical protein
MNQRLWGVGILALTFAACEPDEPAQDGGVVDSGSTEDAVQADVSTDGAIDARVDVSADIRMNDETSGDSAFVDRTGDDAQRESGAGGNDAPRSDTSNIPDGSPNLDGNPPPPVDAPPPPDPTCYAQQTGTCACHPLKNDGGWTDFDASKDGPQAASFFGTDSLVTDRNCFCAGPYGSVCTNFSAAAAAACAMAEKPVVRFSTFDGCDARSLSIRYGRADGGSTISLGVRFKGETFIGARVWGAVAEICSGVPDSSPFDLCRGDVATDEFLDEPLDPACGSVHQTTLCGDGGGPGPDL